MSSRKRKCKNDPDNFCYICGQYTPPVHRRKFTPKVKILYCTSFTLGVKLETRTRNSFLTYAAKLATHSYCNG